MLSKIENVIIKTINIKTAKPTPIITVSYELIDGKGSVYAEGIGTAGWSAEAINNVLNCTKALHASLADLLFITTEASSEGIYENSTDSEPRGLFPKHGDSSI